MRYFIGEYSNGYCGCDEVVFMLAETEEQADAYMEEGLADYGYEYEGCCREEEIDDDETNDLYWENVTYSLREATPEEVEDEDADVWIDIRNY